MTRKGVYQTCCISGGFILALFNHMDSAATWFAASVIIGICAPEDKMTREEALQEAKRRWGLAGEAFDRLTDNPEVSMDVLNKTSRRIGRYWVGSVTGHPDTLYGNGHTWEAAFADADRRRMKG